MICEIVGKSGALVTYDISIYNELSANNVLSAGRVFRVRAIAKRVCVKVIKITDILPLSVSCEKTW